VEPGHVYVIPPNKSMTIRRGVLKLTPRGTAAAPHRPIDEFCCALAADQKTAAIGIVLSGTGTDGTLGLKAIKTEGGVTFAQDPKTAPWPAMPLSAIAAGSVDFVMSPKRIGAELERIHRHPYVVEPDQTPEGEGLDKISIVLRSATGVDLRPYKHATFGRRVARRMALHKIDSLDKYARYLKQNPPEAEALLEDVFIHLTGFFRDREAFDALGKMAFSKARLDRTARDPIRIWVPGCSTGEEVYSIAMLLLDQLGDKVNRIAVQIFGTDIRERPIDTARAGVYPPSAVTGVTPAHLRRYFIKVEQGYQISKTVRDLCVFARHDLSKDPPFSKLDLVSCRNVLIYMGPGLQNRALTVFQYALKPGGLLFLGQSESISAYANIFEAEDRKHRIFSRKPAAAKYQLAHLAGVPGQREVG